MARSSCLSMMRNAVALALTLGLAAAQIATVANAKSATDLISFEVSHVSVTDNDASLGGRPVIYAATEGQARVDLLAFTRKHQGQKIDILVDGRIMFTAVLKGPMFGAVLIPASTVEEAHALAHRLQAHEAWVGIRVAVKDTPSKGG